MTGKICYQVNLQKSFGGGEVYTRFFTETLVSLGWEVELFVARGAAFWHSLGLRGVTLHEVSDETEIRAALPDRSSLIVTHTALSAAMAGSLAGRHILTGFLHMPLYERNPAGFARYARLFAVSRHVLDSAHSRGLSNVYSEPLYAVADLAPRAGAGSGAGAGRIVAASVYAWDLRKLRDRLMSMCAPLVDWSVHRPEFKRRPGLTLGIVSRLTPIKQFPRMFSILAPVLAQHPKVSLEIFGSGGYASMRDLRASLAPLSAQARFWGHQQDVAVIYPRLDYLLAGLPEKEALGLNIIEAQQCGTPVLAVRAPPFTETMIEGETGYFFVDPRQDQGVSFAQLLERLQGGAARPDPRHAVAHLDRFSFAAFRERVARALAGVAPGSIEPE